jgi:hypothetical protein
VNGVEPVGLSAKRVRARRTSLVAALGLFAMRHPILAVGSTLVVGLMLALAAIGVVRVVRATESMRESTPRGPSPRSEAAGVRLPTYVKRPVLNARSSPSIASAV